MIAMLKMNNALKSPIQFSCGKNMKNKFVLGPLINTQSQEDGTLCNEEFNWLTMCAKGECGLVMTFDSHVQFVEKCFLVN